MQNLSMTSCSGHHNNWWEMIRSSGEGQQMCSNYHALSMTSEKDRTATHSRLDMASDIIFRPPRIKIILNTFLKVDKCLARSIHRLFLGTGTNLSLKFKQ